MRKMCRPLRTIVLALGCAVLMAGCEEDLNMAMPDFDQDDALANPDSIVGQWTWGWNGSVHHTKTVNADGSVTSVNISTGRASTPGTWSDLGNRTFRFVWSNGLIDTMQLSTDGHRLEGSNQEGVPVFAYR